MDNWIIGILAIIGGCIGSFLGSYAKKKAENLATKDDIGRITSIVKGIESEFVKNNDILRSTLDLQKQHKLDWKSAERDAYFHYIDAMAVWIYNLANSSYDHYHIGNYKELRKVAEGFIDIRYKLEIATAHLELFVNGDTYFEELNLNFKKEIFDLEFYVCQTIDLMGQLFHDTSIKLQDSMFIRIPNAKSNLLAKLSVDKEAIIQDRSALFLTKYKTAHNTFGLIVKNAKKKIQELKIED